MRTTGHGVIRTTSKPPLLEQLIFSPILYQTNFHGIWQSALIGIRTRDADGSYRAHYETNVLFLIEFSKKRNALCIFQPVFPPPGFKYPCNQEQQRSGWKSEAIDFDRINPISVKDQKMHNVFRVYVEYEIRDVFFWLSHLRKSWPVALERTHLYLLNSARLNFCFFS